MAQWERREQLQRKVQRGDSWRIFEMSDVTEKVMQRENDWILSSLTMQK